MEGNQRHSQREVPNTDEKIEQLLEKAAASKEVPTFVRIGKAFEKAIAPSAETNWTQDGYESLYLSLVSNSVSPEQRNYKLGEDVVFHWAKNNIDFQSFAEGKETGRELTEAEKRKMWADKNTRIQMSLSWAAQHQPLEWDPRNVPPVELINDKGALVGVSTIAKDLKKYVSQELANQLKDLIYQDTNQPFFDPSKLELYVGYGTPADVLAKADIFFLYDGTPMLVDTSLNQEKLNSAQFGLASQYYVYGLSLKNWDIKGLKDLDLARKRLDLSFELESHARQMARTYARMIRQQVEVVA